MIKFLALYDLHWGYERVNSSKKALHDSKAISAAIQFAFDFKPDVLILGGDILDCGVVSHHNHGKPGATEGLKLIADAKELSASVIKPLEQVGAKEMIYITGNHEAWLNQLTDQLPALEGLLDLTSLLELKRWKVIPQGGSYNLGKLTFIHGDQLSGGENAAKAAVVNLERSVRFGHFHTYQAFTKASPIDAKAAKVGTAVPCLCRKNPAYGKGKPNRWAQGFQFGYVGSNGYFNDYTVIVIDGKFVAPDGKVYCG